MTFGRITFKESNNKDSEMKVTETIREETTKNTGVIKQDEEEEVIDMPMIEEDSD
jgi:hypothetical protein